MAAAAVTVQSVVLTLALYEGKDGVLLLGRRQGLGERKSLVNKDVSARVKHKDLSSQAAITIGSSD